MKFVISRTTFSTFLALIGFVSLGRADPADGAVVAAMKLSTAGNYSWETAIDQGSRTATMRGKTNDSGYSLVTFSGYASRTATSGARSQRSSTGEDVNAVFMGDDKFVVQTDKGWADSSSLTSASSASSNSSRGGGGSTGGMGGGGMRAGGGGGRRGGGRSSRNSSSDDSTTNSPPLRIPSGLNLPHEELGIIVANYTEMHVDGDIVSGTLTPLGANLLLVAPGSKIDPPENSAATFRLWIKGGIVTKYEIKLTAKTAPGGRAVKDGFSETITVTLKDVGNTKVEVPDDAKKQLSA